MADNEKNVEWLINKNAELQKKIVILNRQLVNSEDRAKRLNSLVNEMYAYLVRIGKSKEFSVEHDLRETKKRGRRYLKNEGETAEGMGRA